MLRGGGSSRWIGLLTLVQGTFESLGCNKARQTRLWLIQREARGLFHYTMAFWNSSTPSVANTILSAQVDMICSMLDQMYVDCPRIEPSLQLPQGVNYACSSPVFS